MFGSDRNGIEFTGKNTLLNETVNTEAFSSPRSDLITSSPHAGVAANERDAGIISVSFINGYSLSGLLIWNQCISMEFIWYFTAFESGTPIH